MVYGDPTFAFTASEEKKPTQAIVHEPPPLVTTQVVRGTATMAENRKSPHHHLYLILGIFILASIVFGYRQFRSKTGYNENVPSLTKPTTRAEPLEMNSAINKNTQNEKGGDAKQVITLEDQKLASATKPTESPPALVSLSKKTPESIGVKTDSTSPATTDQGTVAVKNAPLTPTATAPLALSMNLIGQRKETDGSYAEVLVTEGSPLRSRDNFQVHLEATRPSYVYILLYDSQGRASQLFPDPKISEPGFVEAGKKLVVPSTDLWFWLDDSTGTETIYVLASERPMADIQGLLAKMVAADDNGKKNASQEIKRQITIMQRGVGGIVKGQSATYILSDGKKIQKVTDVVTGTGSVVRAVSFQHR
jgi:hypothetical protein